MTYKLTLTEEQYNHVEKCVEVVHRISCGQIDALREVLPRCPDYNTLREIKQWAFPELSYGEDYKWSGGYRNDEFGDDFRNAYDKFQAQGYQIWREMEHVFVVSHGIDNVYSSPTLTTHKAKKPIIEVIP